MYRYKGWDFLCFLILYVYIIISLNKQDYRFFCYRHHTFYVVFIFSLLLQYFSAREYLSSFRCVQEVSFKSNLLPVYFTNRILSLSSTPHSCTISNGTTHVLCDRIFVRMWYDCEIWEHNTQFLWIYPLGIVYYMVSKM